MTIHDANRVIVLGAGIAGIAAAQRLPSSRRVVYEQQPHIGGHTHSHQFHGCTFDEGPHVSFTRDETVRALFAQAVHDDFIEFQPQVSNYFRGHWLKHPAQCNLYGLPEDLVVACIRDLARAEPT